MKKRTCVPFYDKTCQRMEARAATLTRVAGKHPKLLDEVTKLREGVRNRLRAKRKAAGVAA